MKDKKEKELGNINGFEISADQKKMLVSFHNEYAILDLPMQKVDMKDKLDLSDSDTYRLLSSGNTSAVFQLESFYEKRQNFQSI